MSFLRNRFSDETSRRYAEKLAQDRRRLAAKERQEKERRKDLAERAEDAVFAFAAAITSPVRAPPERIETFERDLTEFETAIIKALLENEKAMDAVALRIDVMLSLAYVLPDGHRVFRTEDGQSVYDQFGEAVSAEDIDPTEIPAGKPT